MYLNNTHCCDYMYMPDILEKGFARFKSFFWKAFYRFILRNMNMRLFLYQNFAYDNMSSFPCFPSPRNLSWSQVVLWVGEPVALGTNLDSTPALKHRAIRGPLTPECRVTHHTTNHLFRDGGDIIIIHNHYNAPPKINISTGWPKIIGLWERMYIWSRKVERGAGGNRGVNSDGRQTF